MPNRRERAQVRITEFYGVVDSDGAEDLPAGAAQRQVNVASRKLGLLQTRRGYLPVNFDFSLLVDLATDIALMLLDENGGPLQDEDDLVLLQE